MIPLGDLPNPRGLPLVTYAMMGANIAIFVLFAIPLGNVAADPRDPAVAAYIRALTEELQNSAHLREALKQMSAYDVFVFLHGYKPAAPQLSDLFSSLFLHAGPMHLFGNMLFLWIYGDNVEDRLGRLRFLASYLLCGIAATLFHAGFDGDSAMPLIGASGAISGILGFYFKWFPHNKVRLLVFIFPILMQTFLVPARLVLGMYFVMDNLLPFVAASTDARGGVAYGAHIGGFLCGLAIAWTSDLRALRSTPPGFASRVAATSAPQSSVSRLIADGDMGRAAEQYFTLGAPDARAAITPEDSLRLGEWLRQHDHPHAALSVFRRHLRDYPRGPGRASAHLGAGRVHLESLRQPAPAYQHFLDALDADPDSEVETQARRGLAAIAEAQRSGRWRR